MSYRLRDAAGSEPERQVGPVLVGSATVGISTFSFRRELGSTVYFGHDTRGRRVAVSLPGEGAFELEDAIFAVATDFGATAVELFQPHIVSRSPRYVSRIKQAIDASGLRLINVAMSAAHVGATCPAHRSADLTIVVDWLNAAAALGSQYFRVNVAPNPVQPSGPSGEFDVVIESLNYLAAVAEPLGVTVLIENGSRITLDPRDCLAILDSVDPRVGLVLDTGNFEPVRSAAVAGFLGDEPADEGHNPQPLFDAITQLAGRATLVHVKCYGFHGDGSHRLYDLSRALAVLSVGGYAGPFIVEMEVDRLDDLEAMTRLAIQAVQNIGAS